MRRALAVPLFFAAAIAACADDPPPVAEATSAAAGAVAPVVSASAEPQALVDAGSIQGSTEAGAPEPTSSASAAAPPDAGAKPDAGKKPVKDAGTTDAGKLASVPDAGGTGPGAPDAAAAPAIPPPAPGTANAVAADVDKIFGPARTFTAKFKQENTQKVSGVVKKSSGVLFVEKPNKISFRYDAPNKNRIVSDGTEIKVYIADDNVMYVQPVSGTQYPGALAFIMGHGLLPSFEFTFQDPTPWTGGPVLIGQPRTPTPHYTQVFFYVDKPMLESKDPNVIRRVLVLDAQKNKNRFDFESASQPATIDPAEFVFSPPPGTDIKK
jgi:outer membrane lipoprotein-sorting protein